MKTRAERVDCCPNCGSHDLEFDYAFQFEDEADDGFPILIGEGTPVAYCNDCKSPVQLEETKNTKKT